MRPSPILSAWDSLLARHPDRPAILGTDGATLRTFAEIEAESQSSPLEAHRAVLKPGSVIAIQVGNDPILLSLLLWAWRSGCIPLLLDLSLEGASRDAALDVAGASALVTWNPASTGGPAVTLRAGRPLDPDTHFLKLTSGTTSAPRVIRFTADQLVADCENICATMGITAEDRNFGVIPWSHSYGFSNLITPLLCRGIALVAANDRLPRAILSGLASSGATVFPGLPVFFQKLAELPAIALPRLRLCISAGAPLAASTAKAFRALYGLKIHGFYGSSECGGIAYDPSEEDVVEGCVGPAMHGVTLDHDELTGRVAIRSAAVGLGYHPDPDPAVLGDGCFIPGDLLERTLQGFVIAGRISDFINIAGRKLNPLEVEHLLRTCPGVREAIVFGVPHPRRGEEPIACIIGDASQQELQAHCARQLAAWQVPRDFWSLESLPVNERGKWSRRQLAELYLQAKHSVPGT